MASAWNRNSAVIGVSFFRRGLLGARMQAECVNLIMVVSSRQNGAGQGRVTQHSVADRGAGGLVGVVCDVDQARHPAGRNSPGTYG